jgi:hypothetical protein
MVPGRTGGGANQGGTQWDDVRVLSHTVGYRKVLDIDFLDSAQRGKVVACTHPKVGTLYSPLPEDWLLIFGFTTAKMIQPLNGLCRI